MTCVKFIDDDFQEVVPIVSRILQYAITIKMDTEEEDILKLCKEVSLF